MPPRCPGCGRRAYLHLLDGHKPSCRAPWAWLLMQMLMRAISA